MSENLSEHEETRIFQREIRQSLAGLLEDNECIGHGRFGILTEVEVSDLKDFLLCVTAGNMDGCEPGLVATINDIHKDDEYGSKYRANGETGFLTALERITFKRLYPWAVSAAYLDGKQDHVTAESQKRRPIYEGSPQTIALGE